MAGGTDSKAATLVTAAFMIAVGVLTGSPAYILMDVIAVGVATWISLNNITPTYNSSESKIKLFFKGMLGELASGAFLIFIVFAIFAGGIIFYNRVLGDCADSKLAQLNMTFEQCRDAQKRSR